jgi:divalent metal cation (Fe/Co/Zn/Cd) transporter
MKQKTIKTLFKVPKMDCPSEEQMIRMTLEALPIQSLSFDLQNRLLTVNDVIANIGVIIAGILVAWTASPIPDWIIGLLIAFLVLSGALRILKLK